MVRKKKMTETGDLYALDKKWHISRGVPVALIVTVIGMFIGQTVGGVWYVSHLDSRVDAVEKVQVTAAVIVEKVQAATASQNIETAKLGEKVVAVQASVNRIEALLTKPR